MQKSTPFSEFAKILYVFYHEETESQFVITLTDNIMRGQPGRAIGDDGYRNPMRGKDTIRILQYYFSGGRNISKGDASVILYNLDKYKFEKFIDKFSDDAQRHIEEDLENLTNENLKNLLKRVDEDLNDSYKAVHPDKEVPVAMRLADLFESILYEIVT